jgi:hypothetical protein
MSLPAVRGAPDWDAGDTLADRFRAHAGDTEHLYGYAMRGMADDWEAGGPTRLVCCGYENAPHGAVIQLRLLAGVFRLVLTGRAPVLSPYYPCLGGTDPASQVWPAMREVIAAHTAELNEALTVAPQTNEVGRAARCSPASLTLLPTQVFVGSPWSSSEPAPASICWSTATASTAVIGVLVQLTRRSS